jgi:hypothetical protein
LLAPFHRQYYQSIKGGSLLPHSKGFAAGIFKKCIFVSLKQSFQTRPFQSGRQGTSACHQKYKMKGEKMAKNPAKTVLRDSENGQFISKRRAASKPPNTWQKERVPVRNPKPQSPHRHHRPGGKNHERN